MSRLFNEIKDSIKEVGIYPSVTVTPSLAKELLTLNTNNRPLKTRITKLYAREMKAGNWTFSGGNIVFSNTGRVLDGQHRLEAIVLAETPQTFNIQTGIKDEAFDVIDTGTIRTAGDILSVKGYNNASAMAGAIRLILNYYEGNLSAGKNIEGNKKQTNVDIANWLEVNGEAKIVRCISEGVRIYRSGKTVSPPMMAGFIFLFSEGNTDLNYGKAITFFELLASGENISRTVNSSIYHLREEFLKFQISRHTMSLTVKYAMVIKAWNAFVTNRPLKKLKWQINEEFPRINRLK